jgi:hypothetical protein
MHKRYNNNSVKFLFINVLSQWPDDDDDDDDDDYDDNKYKYNYK